jgi:hypothetical protein
VANVNNPFGLEPLMRSAGGGFPQTEQWTKAAAYGYAIFKWDPVTRLAGVLNGPASGITPGTTNYFGVSLNWAAASTLSSHQIIVDPYALFKVQGDGSGGSDVTAAVMGYNANLNVASVAGGGITRDNSGVQLTETSINTTSSLDVNIQSLWNTPTGQNNYGANAILCVIFNKHLRNKGVTQT